MSARKKELSQAERDSLRQLFQALEKLRVLKHNMPLHMAITFLRVALDEGKSITDLTKDSGVAQSVMSRHVLDLGPQNRDKTPGLGLIEHRMSPTNLRQHDVYLTPKGTELARNLAATLRGSKGWL